MLTIVCLRYPRCVKHLVRQFTFNLNQKAIVIAAAVRTPNTFHFQRNSNEEQLLLAVNVIDGLVKRSAVPRNEFKKLILCASDPDCVFDSSGVDSGMTSIVAKNLELKSCQTLVIKDEICSVSGLQMSWECLQRGEDDCIILGDTRSNINIKYATQDMLASELITSPVIPWKNQTKESSDMPSRSPGAAAITLTTAEMAERLQLQPLALFREYFIEKDHLQAVVRVCNNPSIQLNDVHVWHLVMQQYQHDDVTSMLHDLNPNVNNVHTHDVQKITASHLLTHTVHALPAGSLGCVIMEPANGKECILMVLEKLIPPLDELPQLTLYTKDPCPLCEDLVAQLHENFAGEFELKKVFIDRKENVRFLRLFRYDIPVLFLNGQFLCMHRLNVDALRERLIALKSVRERKQKSS